MTVAVGFMCSDGIVLAADREVSTSNSKFDGPKAWIYAYPSGAADPVLRIGLVGAGDYAFIKYASERIDAQLAMWITQHGSASIDEAHNAVQVVVTDIHRNHLYRVGQQHERPTIDLFVGLWLSDGQMRLLRISLTAITTVANYEAVGIGTDLANFLVRRQLTDRIRLPAAMFWATHVLMHAKNYVPGCGGSSDVIAMFQIGTAGFAQLETIKKYERFATDFESAIQSVFLSGADDTLTDDAFMQLVDELATKLKTGRDPNFLQRQAEQVRESIRISDHISARLGRAPHMTYYGSTGLVGNWITNDIAKGADTAETNPNDDPKEKPTEEDQ